MPSEHNRQSIRRAVLIGAGFSYDLGMPLAKDLTEVFLSRFTERAARALTQGLCLAEPYGEDRPITPDAIREGMDLVLQYRADGGNNYEALLTQLQEKGEEPARSQPERDSFHYLFSVLYEILHRLLVSYQLHSYDVLYAENSPWFAGLKNILTEHETWVFSLNHDLYVECLAIDLGIPITYGNTGTLTFPLSNRQTGEQIAFGTTQRSDLVLDNPSWYRNTRAINLVRLHGGLCEHEYSNDAVLCDPSLERTSSADLIAELRRIESMAYFHDGKRVPSGRWRTVTGPDGTLDILTRAVLTGGRKYARTTNPKKGEEKIQLFESVLGIVDELMVIGYGYGDRHVNHRISNALLLHPSLRVRRVDPLLGPVPEFLEQFDYGDRLLYGGRCTAAEWLAYLPHQKWNPQLSEALRQNRTQFAEIRRLVAQRPTGDKKGNATQHR